MDKSFTLIPTVMLNKVTITEIIWCNQITAHYGLRLSPAQAQELVETHQDALSSNGRIEFAGGTLKKLIIAFCDSPFLAQSHYASTLNELVETFYYFKNETLDAIGDDELIALMKLYFDRNCQGSVELLQGRELEVFARNIRYGISEYPDAYAEREKSLDKENYDD